MNARVSYSFQRFPYGACPARSRGNPKISLWLSVDPLAGEYPGMSPYNYTAGNPINLVDPDGRKVIPTNALKANKDLYKLFLMAQQNSVYKKVFRYFINDYNHVYIHVAQLKRNGKPTGFVNTARTEPWGHPKNPVGKYDIHRIILNADLLSDDGKLNVDKTFVFRALLHEGIHAMIFERMKEGILFDFPGHVDYRSRGGEWQHNQMAAFYRDVLIKGMKEFDDQLRAHGENVPDYHTEEWYEAMSWYGLMRTEAWEDLKKENPKKAQRIKKLIFEQIKRNKEAIQN